MTKKNMMLTAMAGAIMTVGGGGVTNVGGGIPRQKRKPKKLHWKETQTDSEREERLKKAEEKRQRKAKKKGIQ